MQILQQKKQNLARFSIKIPNELADDIKQLKARLASEAPDLYIDLDELIADHIEKVIKLADKEIDTYKKEKPESLKAKYNTKKLTDLSKRKR